MLPLSSKAYWSGGISSLETTETEYLSMAKKKHKSLKFQPVSWYIFTYKTVLLEHPKWPPQNLQSACKICWIGFSDSALPSIYHYTLNLIYKSFIHTVGLLYNQKEGKLQNENKTS